MGNIRVQRIHREIVGSLRLRVGALFGGRIDRTGLIDHRRLRRLDERHQRALDAVT